MDDTITLVDAEDEEIGSYSREHIAAHTSFPIGDADETFPVYTDRKSAHGLDFCLRSLQSYEAEFERMTLAEKRAVLEMEVLHFNNLSRQWGNRICQRLAKKDPAQSRDLIAGISELERLTDAMAEGCREVVFKGLRGVVNVMIQQGEPVDWLQMQNACVIHGSAPGLQICREFLGDVKPKVSVNAALASLDVLRDVVDHEELTREELQTHDTAIRMVCYLQKNPDTLRQLVKTLHIEPPPEVLADTTLETRFAEILKPPTEAASAAGGGGE